MVVEFAPPRVVTSQDADGSIARFAEVLKRYDERFDLEYIPEADHLDRSPYEVMHPFRIVSRTADKGYEIVRWLGAEEFKHPEKILAWLYEADFRKHRPEDIFDKIKAERAFDNALKAAKQRDDAQQRQDLAAFLVSGGREKKNRVQLGRNHYFDRSR